MFRFFDPLAGSVRRWRPALKLLRALLVLILLTLTLQTASVADVETLPPPLCTAATERGYVDVSEFQRNYVTPQGHFTIWFETTLSFCL